MLCDNGFMKVTVEGQEGSAVEMIQSVIGCNCAKDAEVNAMDLVHAIDALSNLRWTNEQIQALATEAMRPK